MGKMQFVLYQDPQRNAFWLVLCNEKPPKKHSDLGGPDTLGPVKTFASTRFCRETAPKGGLRILFMYSKASKRHLLGGAGRCFLPRTTLENPRKTLETFQTDGGP